MVYAGSRDIFHGGKFYLFSIYRQLHWLSKIVSLFILLIGPNQVPETYFQFGDKIKNAIMFQSAWGELFSSKIFHLDKQNINYVNRIKKERFN